MRSRAALAKNLKELRKALGFSQEELAGRANLDRTYISGVERSKFSVGLDSLDALAEALTVAPEDLIRGGTKPPS